MNVPIPLGGIATRNSFKRSLATKIDRLVKQSLEHAFSRYPLISDYVKLHSQSMSEDVMRKHIDLYVNNYSLDLGEEGKNAIRTLYKTFQSTNSQQEEQEEMLFL